MTRLEREFNLDVIATSPSVIYEVDLTNGETVLIDSPSKFPDRGNISEIREPYIKTNIFVPKEYIGPIMELCKDKRGNYVSMDYIDEKRVDIHYEIPLSEIVYDFFDKLKSMTKGYASFDYELRKIIPRQLFIVPLQASVGSKIIARETISAMRKNVLAKCYGGDISRKKKLLEKQKAGKKRMKMVGHVEIPQEAFLSVLSADK